jgi:hypothetical protein
MQADPNLRHLPADLVGVVSTLVHRGLVSTSNMSGL